MKQKRKNKKLSISFTKIGISLTLVIAGFLSISLPLHRSLAAVTYGCVAWSGNTYAWVCSEQPSCYDVSCTYSSGNSACKQLDPSLCGTPDNSNNGPSPGVAGSSCGGSLSACGAGLNCVNLKCIDPNANAGNPPANPSNPPAPPPSAGNCPTGLVSVNGLCLPPSQFKTGIASSNSLTEFLLTLIKILLSFAGVIAVVMLVVGGYWYMAAGGNEEMSEKGKKTILNFVLGLVVIILAYTIVTIISSTLTGADKLLK